MAKQKKPRNKKYNPKVATERTAHTVAENALNRITFIGSSIRRLGPYAGRGFHFTASPRIRAIATDMLVGGLFDQPRPWHLWVMHLTELDTGEIVTETAVATLDDYTLADFCEHAEELVKSLRPEQEEGKYYGYAFVAAPNERYDFKAEEDQLIENFMHSGLLDTSLHLSEEQQFVSRADMAKLLVGYTRKFDVTVEHVKEVPEIVSKKDEVVLPVDEVVGKVATAIGATGDY